MDTAAEVSTVEPATLLAAVRERDQAAFTQLVAAYDHELLRLAFVIAGNRPAAEDAAQAAWEHLRSLARTTSKLGPADGVVTFAYPLSWSEFLDFEALGVSVADLEFVTDPDADGLRVTYVMARSGANPGWVDEEASEANVDVIGIVSANVTVPDLATLERLEASGYVYLVDLSIADFKRLNPGASDILQNDVYWSRAGWL